MGTEVEVLEHLGNSDHNIIVWSLILDVGQNKYKRPSRKYHKADYVEMSNWFNDINWVQEYNELNVDEMWHKYCSFIDQAINMFVPLGYNKRRKNRGE